MSSLSSTSKLLLAAASGVVGGVAAVHAWKHLSQSCSCCSSSSSSSVSCSPRLSPLQYEKKPMIVTVSGAGGQIGYSIIFQIAAGRMLGNDQPIELRLLEIPPVLNVVRGVVMELEDCAFPLITKVTATSDANEAFQGTQVALLIGGRPRGPGMSRADLLKFNAEIFKLQGAALDKHADRNVKVLVVANPANTNALIAHLHAPSLPSSAFSAMTRLDQNRAVAQLAKRLSVSPAQLRNVTVWGNHSSTQYPDVTHAQVFDRQQRKWLSVQEAVNDEEYLRNEFISSVQKRGAAIIDALGKSSAASAANAAVEHVRDWILGTREGEWVSMGVVSDGSYGVAKGLVYSFPVKCRKGGEWEIVQGLEVSEFSRGKLKATEKELEEEKADATGGK